MVFRFSYAGPWFVAFAVIGGWILQGLPAWPAHYRWLVVLSPALLTLCVSRFVIHGPANTDTASVFRSLEIRARDSVGIQFDRRQLLALNNRIKQAPPPPPGKRNIFLIRADLQSYARAATGVYVLGDRLNAVSKSLYDTWPERNDYQLVTIDLPADFPVDQEMRRAFPEMAL